ncbi:cobalamin-binding protein [Silvimonas iriomotensis]|uniref:Cobalamin-binding protein n=1 Tax=Silvimonas iriomotensis TaxID=449662 RepID=A0ABQ2PCH2_9NEIS|nr:cobalamin-binding protein [Silvimonas iriomotensis]GGP22912.1 cobalamin-binding protein [Silvimonas iriomotensis]
MKRFAVGLVAALLPALAWPAVRAKDDNGTVVELAQPARRVITLAPHATELVAALAPEAIVAVDTASDYPDLVKKLPKVADFQSLNVEAILAARPDLVVVWESQAVNQSVAQLQRQHIPVFVSRPQTPDDVGSSLRRLGSLLGVDAKADELATAQETRYHQLLRQYQRARPVRVYLQVSENPLLSLSRRSFLGQMLADCGATSPYANARGEAPQVSTEAVLAFAPEIMFTTGAKSTLDMWKAWPQIPAVKSNRLLALSGDQFVRPGPRLIDGMQKICEQIDVIRH